MEVTLLDTTDTEAVRAAVRPNTKLIHVETPGNPTTGISDKLPHYPAVYQEGFFRFSVGLEDAEDIIADLQQAMQAAGML